MTDYANNLTLSMNQITFQAQMKSCIYTDLRDSKEYTKELQKLRTDYITLVLNLKATTTNNETKVFVYSQGECLYIPTDKGLTMKYRT